MLAIASQHWRPFAKSLVQRSPYQRNNSRSNAASPADAAGGAWLTGGCACCAVPEFGADPTTRALQVINDVGLGSDPAFALEVCGRGATRVLSCVRGVRSDTAVPRSRCPGGARCPVRVAHVERAADQSASLQGSVARPQLRHCPGKETHTPVTCSGRCQRGVCGLQPGRRPDSRPEPQLQLSRAAPTARLARLRHPGKHRRGCCCCVTCFERARPALYHASRADSTPAAPAQFSRLHARVLATAAEDGTVFIHELAQVSTSHTPPSQ